MEKCGDGKRIVIWTIITSGPITRYQNGEDAVILYEIGDDIELSENIVKL